ncbi:pleckstrin homology domain-containing family A member 2 [Chanos chanos]|uniref:Pleckstrin homology domain-containing family A member 2 n=1 Tax=Chanos chanos TaxID=29144 RepID=A0A6J2WHB8_CHACN|nr:pleckstrin homology domain-containing family A member 2-like [Chanos chanos]
MPYLDRQNRICGFLDIEENENSDRFYRRYFILDTHNNFLYWYMDNPQNLPVGAECVGSLRLSYISKVGEATVKQKPKAEFCFVIHALSRRYFLQANDAVDMKEWVIALNKATKITVPRPSVVTQTADIAIATTQSQSTARQAYKTEIVGGVVVQTPIQQNEADDVFIGEAPSHVTLKRVQKCHPSVVRSGYCVKQGNVRKSWKRRFFTLNDHAVSYYKNEMDKEPLRSIRLMDIQKVHECLVKSGDLLTRDNLFEIITNTRTFYIQADSPEEMNGWIRDIQSKIQDFRGPTKSANPVGAGHSKPLLTKSCSVAPSWQPWTPIPKKEAQSRGADSARGGHKESSFSSLPTLAHMGQSSQTPPRQRHHSQPQAAPTDRGFPFQIDTNIRSSDV